LAEGAWRVGRILVGVDGSAGAARAVRWAAELATSVGAPIVLVHALTYDQELLRDLTPDTMRTWRRDLEHQMRATWAQPATDAGVEHRCKVVEAGSVAEALLQSAEVEGAGLVVIGAKKRESMVSRLTSSTVERLVHRARVPIVVVPPT